MQSQKSSHMPTGKPQQPQGTQQQEQPGRQREQQNRSQQDPQGRQPSDVAQQQGGQPFMRPNDPPTQASPSMDQNDKDPVQGEGDYRADRRYTESVRDFVEAGKVDAAARNAKPQSEQEAKEMREAEQEGASHAKDGKQRPSDDPAMAQRG